jgi:DNA-binding NtrC family response regulator
MNDTAHPALEPYLTLLDVAKAIASHRHVSDLFQDLAASLHRLLEFHYLSVVLHDAAQHVMRLHNNVRELQNVIERAVILTPDTVLRLPPAEWQHSRSSPDIPTSSRTLAEVEREHILQALQETNGMIGGPQGAAARLGLRHTTLLYRMEKFGIPRRPA